MKRRALVTLAAAALLVTLGCSKKEDVIVHAGDQGGKSAAEIDSDPLALLPGGAISVGVLDAKALFDSQFGDKLLEISRRRAPLPESAGFDPKRDLSKVYFGVYSMQGADVAGVAVGTFDVAKIEAAADGTQKTPLGVTVTKSTYAGRKLYTAESIGFTILTARTALFGNTTGIRRALDRVREGRAKRELAPWSEKVLTGAAAPFVYGSNLKDNPVPNALRQRLPFLDGVETVGLVGNFAPPGVNVAGTLTYPDEAAAKTGAERVVETRALLDRYAPFLALLGIPQPVKKLESEAQGSEARFVAGIDAQAVAVVLTRAEELLNMAQPRPAQ